MQSTFAAPVGNHQAFLIPAGEGGAETLTPPQVPPAVLLSAIAGLVEGVTDTTPLSRRSVDLLRGLAQLCATYETVEAAMVPSGCSEAAAVSSALAVLLFAANRQVLDHVVHPLTTVTLQGNGGRVTSLLAGSLTGYGNVKPAEWALVAGTAIDACLPHHYHRAAQGGGSRARVHANLDLGVQFAVETALPPGVRRPAAALLRHAIANKAMARFVPGAHAAREPLTNAGLLLMACDTTRDVGAALLYHAGLPADQTAAGAGDMCTLCNARACWACSVEGTMLHLSSRFPDTLSTVQLPPGQTLKSVLAQLQVRSSLGGNPGKNWGKDADVEAFMKISQGNTLSVKIRKVMKLGVAALLGVLVLAIDPGQSLGTPDNQLLELNTTSTSNTTSMSNTTSTSNNVIWTIISWFTSNSTSEDKLTEVNEPQPSPPPVSPCKAYDLKTYGIETLLYEQTDKWKSYWQSMHETHEKCKGQGKLSEAEAKEADESLCSYPKNLGLKNLEAHCADLGTHSALGGALLGGDATSIRELHHFLARALQVAAATGRRDAVGLFTVMGWQPMEEALSTFASRFARHLVMEADPKPWMHRLLGQWDVQMSLLVEGTTPRSSVRRSARLLSPDAAEAGAMRGFVQNVKSVLAGFLCRAPVFAEVFHRSLEGVTPRDGRLLTQAVAARTAVCPHGDPSVFSVAAHATYVTAAAEGVRTALATLATPSSDAFSVHAWVLSMEHELHEVVAGSAAAAFDAAFVDVSKECASHDMKVGALVSGTAAMVRDLLTGRTDVDARRAQQALGKFHSDVMRPLEHHRARALSLVRALLERCTDVGGLQAWVADAVAPPTTARAAASLAHSLWTISEQLAVRLRGGDRSVALPAAVCDRLQVCLQLCGDGRGGPAILLAPGVDAVIRKVAAGAAPSPGAWWSGLAQSKRGASRDAPDLDAVAFGLLDACTKAWASSNAPRRDPTTLDLPRLADFVHVPCSKLGLGLALSRQQGAGSAGAGASFLTTVLAAFLAVEELEKVVVRIRRTCDVGTPPGSVRDISGAGTVEDLAAAFRTAEQAVREGAAAWGSDGAQGLNMIRPAWDNLVSKLKWLSSVGPGEWTCAWDHTVSARHLQEANALFGCLQGRISLEACLTATRTRRLSAGLLTQVINSVPPQLRFLQVALVTLVTE